MVSNSLREVLFYFAIKYDGDFTDIYEAFSQKEPIDESLLKQYKKLSKHKYVTLIDKNYPTIYKLQECPLFLIFYEGNIKLVEKELSTISSTNEIKPRSFIELNSTNKKGKEIIDYVVGSESYNDLYNQIKLLKDKNIPLKNYSKTVQKER